MSGRLNGKRALITGSARGIGRACALRFAEEGADIALVDIAEDVATVPYSGARPEQLEATRVAVEGIWAARHRLHRRRLRSGEPKELCRRSDIGLGRNRRARDRCRDRFWGTAWELSEDEWLRMLDVNLSGVWRTAKAVAPAMIDNRSGVMVFIGSVLSHRANSQFAHYTAAKHGVLGLTRAFALELAPSMVRVNSVDPTVVRTDMVSDQAYLDHLCGHLGATEEEAQRRYLEWNTLPVPWVESVDVANAALFLASDEARYITGVALPVDLGALLK